jgi:hypothetical protein
VGELFLLRALAPRPRPISLSLLLSHAAAPGFVFNPTNTGMEPKSGLIQRFTYRPKERVEELKICEGRKECRMGPF